MYSIIVIDLMYNKILPLQIAAKANGFTDRRSRIETQMTETKK